MSLLKIPYTSVQKFQKEDAAGLATGRTFNNRFALYTAMSPLVKEKKFPIDHYGLVVGSEAPVDLGPWVHALFLSWRPKAVLFMGPGNQPVQSFKKDSALFQKIKVGADAGGKNNPYQYGIEFFCWLPKEKQLACIMMGTKTARNTASGMLDIYDAGKLCELNSKLIKGKEFMWQAITATVTSAPMHNEPDWEKVAMDIAVFQNELDSEMPAEADASAQQADR